MKAERGVPLWSVSMCLFVPSLALSVGLGPVLPPEWRLDRARVERLPLPLDPPQLVVLPEEPDPQLLEDPFADPLLESAMGRGARPVLLRESLPLAPCPEHVQNAVKDPPERHRRPPSGARHLLLPEERLYLCPQIVRDAPDRGQLVFHDASVRDRCLCSIESKRVGHPVYFWDRLLVIRASSTPCRIVKQLGSSPGVVETRAQEPPESGDRDHLARIMTSLLGAFWILDGILQFQPASFTQAFVTGILSPNLPGQPAFLRGLLNLGIAGFSAHPFIADLAVGVVQLAIGAILLLSRKRSFQVAALYASIVWALVVWVFGEGSGLVFTGSASFYTGAPGSVLLYLILAVFLLYPTRLALARLPFVVGAVLFLGVILQVLPIFWSSSGVQSVFQATSSDPVGAIAAPATRLLVAVSSAPVLANLVLVGILAALGGVLILRPGRFVAWSVAVFLIAVWWLCQDFGQIQTFPGGTATDPNSALILILFLVPLMFGFRVIGGSKTFVPSTGLRILL